MECNGIYIQEAAKRDILARIHGRVEEGLKVYILGDFVLIVHMFHVQY